MPIDVRLPSMLRDHAGGEASIAADGATIGEVFTRVVEQYPGLRANLLADDGGLHKFVNVYRNDDDIRYLDALDTSVSDGDVISILPAVAGGSDDISGRPHCVAGVPGAAAVRDSVLARLRSLAHARR